MKRVIAWSIVCLLTIAPILSAVPFGDDGSPSDERGPVDTGTPWSDTFDDTSKVYIPTGGLVGVEVVGGEVRLKGGATEGWIASEIITCPEGYRYDRVLLDAVIPANSSISISVLNASVPGSGDTANATITDFNRTETTDLSLTPLWQSDYPKIRLQAALQLNGTKGPRLNSWTLFYIEEDTWYEDFASSGKLSFTKELNITYNRVEVNLTAKKVSDIPEYEPYPSIFYAKGGNSINFNAIHPNADHSSYQDPIDISGNATHGIDFGDLDGDGNLDMVQANLHSGSNGRKAEIRWGAGTDPWSSTRTTFIPSIKGCGYVYIADYNGDGDQDLLFANSDDYPSCIFFNQGGGSFNANPDVTGSFIMGDGSREVGDINNDGYVDTIDYTHRDGINIFYSGPKGPDPDVYEYKDIDGLIHGIDLWDVDQDGYLDLMVGKRSIPSEIYLGGPNGFSDEPDFCLTISQPACYGFECGDINGDGFLDINAQAWTYNPVAFNTFALFMGSANGWRTTPNHEFEYKYGSLFDVNKDGYADIVGRDTDNRTFIVCYGGEEWDDTPDIEKRGFASPLGPIFCIPKGTGSIYHRGTLVTEVIHLPKGKNWDILKLDLDVPNNTTAAISVTDAENNTIEGFGSRTDDCIDLSPIVDKRAIRIVVTLTSELNNTTPILRSIILKWMDIGTWRDQFYGSFRIDRSVAMGVVDGRLIDSSLSGTAPQVLFASLRNDMGYLSMSELHIDAGGLDYVSGSSLSLPSIGAIAADTADVNGDGLLDIAIASYQKYSFDFDTESLIILGTPVGFRDTPDEVFDTKGARDVILDDLNGDGHIDIVFAQEQDGFTYAVDSLLFWGSEDGWNDSADVRFKTKGASGVISEDLDDDGYKDLVFACYKDQTTATDSLVFLQGTDGFCGTAPDHRLPTEGARAVASGHLNVDNHLDLVFANSEASGSPETDSFVYMGKAGGGFSTSPLRLPTSGANDVKVGDLDGDKDADIVFANSMNDLGNRGIMSFVYLRGDFGFQGSPDRRLPTDGAVGVAICDLDGTGWKDLVFACHRNDTSFEVDSVGYLGGASGWSSEPDIVVPTKGASDVVVARFFEKGHGGYMSMPITPEDPHKTGTFHTLRCTASVQGGSSGTMSIYDARSWEVLASTSLEDGDNEWLLDNLLFMKHNPSIRIVVDLDGLDKGSFTLDDLWINWTPRVERPPSVQGIELTSTSVHRMDTVHAWIDVYDEYDAPGDLMVQLQHRLEGETRWVDWIVTEVRLEEGKWRAEIAPGKDAVVGIYHFRVLVWDSDDMNSGWTDVEGTLEVLNNPPSMPEISLGPVAPTTESTLQVSIVRSGTDREGGAISLRFFWYKDGDLVGDLTGDRVPPERTSKGQNWSLEVRAFDGDDEGPPATAWVVIQNSPPALRGEVPEPILDEDTEDTSVEMWRLFTDPDGDALDWEVDGGTTHLSVTIDPETGFVTIIPDSDWFGEETLTFTASDGEYSVEATVVVTVNPVNDIPWIMSINGDPVTGDPITLTVLQDETLVISVVAEDKEGDDLVFTVDTEMVIIDGATGEMTYTPTNEDIGEFTLTLSMSDVVSPEGLVELTITVVVENVNDPPATPRITSPTSATVIEVNDSVTFKGSCEDPDELHGQILTYTWSSDISGHLGDGRVLEFTFLDDGTHTIILVVSDGEHEASVSMTIQVNAPEPPPPPEPPDEKKEKDESPGLTLLLTVISIFLARCMFAHPRGGRKD